MDNVEIDRIIDKYRYKTRWVGQKNSVVKHVSALIANTKPNPRKLFVLEGIWAFNMALRANLKIINFLLAPECVFSPEAYELSVKFAEIAEDISILSKKVFLTLSERDEPDGLMAVCALPEWNLEEVNVKNSLIVVLDGLEIPGNVGTLIRSADAAKIDAMFICNKKARLTHPKVIKGSMGAIFFKPLFVFDTVEECKNWLLAHEFSIYLADTRAEKMYTQYSYSGNTALIVGSERYGISREWYDKSARLLSIPMLGECDSLNVAIAATVIMYEMRIKKSFMQR